MVAGESAGLEELGADNLAQRVGHRGQIDRSADRDGGLVEAFVPTWLIYPQLVTGVVSNKPVQLDLIAPAATVSSYDGAGRPVGEIFYVGNPDNHANEQWRTVTRYDGKYIC